MTIRPDWLAIAKSRLLTGEEITAIVEELQHPTGAYKTYNLIYALGRGAWREQAPVVEPFLDAEDDPMLARIALQVLCTMWDMPERYLDRAIEFSRGVAWDARFNVQSLAVDILGRYAAARHDPRALRALIERLDTADADGDDITRDAVISAMARPLEHPWAGAYVGDVPDDPEERAKIKAAAEKLVDQWSRETRPRQN